MQTDQELSRPFDAQDLESNEFNQIPQPQNLFNQHQNQKMNYSRDLVTVLENHQVNKQVKSLSDQKQNQNQSLQQKRPTTSNNRGKVGKNQEERKLGSTQRPSSAKLSQSLSYSPSTSNIVKTISQRMNNLEQLTAQLRITENEIQKYAEEKNNLQLQLTNMKKEIILIKDQLETLNQSIKKMHLETATYQKQNDTIVNKQITLYLELQNFSKETAELQQQQAEQEKQLKDMTSQIDFEKKACEDFTDYIKALKKKIADEVKERDNIKARSNNMQKQSQQLRERIENQEKESHYFIHSLQHSGSKQSIFSQF